MPKKLNLNPTQMVVLGFVVAIFTGTILLYLPISTNEPISFLDALFTATSAVCVTGLVVVDTGTRFTVFGQIVIMFLIQIGGLGLMTSATLIFLLTGKKIHLRERLIIQEQLNQFSLEGLVRLSKYIFRLTFFVEGIGAALLAIEFIPQFGIGKGIFFSIFHAVSAFCNAGFDLMGNFASLTAYKENTLVTLVISSLFVVGGLGFTVVLDLYGKRNFSKLNLHSKMVLTVTVFLIIVAAVGIFALEYSNPETLGNLSIKGKILGAYFQAVTPRTAGFNTIPIDKMTSTSLFLIITLMFIGASPASTGGGIKTATFGTIVAAIIALVRGNEDVDIFKKRIPLDIVMKSFVIVFMSLTLITVVTIILTATEASYATFKEVLFEVTSAFGTVGLSMGITTNLTTIGRIFIIITMFAGRVGPLSLALAIGNKKTKKTYHYPEEKLLVG
ncbi:MAG: trk/ktr system potassium uptake protein [Thermosediminibacterales bacterium]|nr:trk/ktr system potassium uptake protein [Thermosediminibacterales bacterium]MDK2836435.1 trk/ktr system potassium uptake protein [Thermosediminibacterales bacterium]